MGGDADFAGRVCLVTGGSKGQGRAISRELAARGGHVVVNWFHDRDSADETVSLIEAAGGSAEHLRASVAKADSVTEMFAEIEKRHGRLDVLVNNAARGVFEPAEVLTEHDWHRAFETNVHGPRRCARAAFPLMKDHGGSIVNLGSIGTSVAIDNYSCVAVCKGALEALTRYLAVEFGPFGIRVNMASASMLVSDTVKLFPNSEQVLDAVVAGTPLGRLGSLEEHAQLVAFLASGQSAWITGENIVNDGGLRLGSALARAGGTWGGRPPADRTPVSAPLPQAVEPVASAVSPVAQSQGEDECVAVVGMGLVVPGADDPAQFWDLLLHGEPAFSAPGDRYPAASHWAAEPGDQDRTYAAVSGFVRTGRDEGVAATASLSSSWLRRAVKQALPPPYGPEVRAALFVGACADGDQHFEQAMVVEGFARRLAEQWPDRAGDRTELLQRLRTMLLGHYGMAAGEAETHLPDGVVREAIRGLLPAATPYTVVDTACSSSLYAIDLGAASVLEGRSDVALCGGYFMVSPRFNTLFGKLGGLSRSGDVRAFDKAADGTLFSDGAAIVALKRLSDARRDGDQVLGVLAGFGASADGRGKSIAAPNAKGQRLAVDRAHRTGGDAVREVDWVVAHGTGTRAGDEVELTALGESHRDHTRGSAEMLCTSNKSLVGHTGWAAGAVSVIHALLGLEHDLVPGQSRLDAGISGADEQRLTIPSGHTAIPKKAGRPRTVGVSGFGFGGTNGHQLVQDAPEPGAPAPRSRPAPGDEPVVLVAWSAHLPGSPAKDEVVDRLRAGLPPSEAAAFPSPYPAPPIGLTRMPPAVSAAVDRTQLMALEVTARFVDEHGLLWQGLEETTAVVAAHYGPSRSWFDTALRCYADDLREVRPTGPGGVDRERMAEAVEAVIADVRRNTVPTNQDSQPGLMGNVTPARIANRYDLNGPVLLADTGATSSQSAFEVASRYLREGRTDLALVLALNGNSTAELSELLTSKTQGAPLGEGAFLFALARESDAVAANWPVLGTVTVEPPDIDRQRTPAPVRVRDYLGANGALDLLTTVHNGKPGPVAEFPAPQVTFTRSEEMAQASPDRFGNDRYVCGYVEEPGPPASEESPEPDADWLVVVQPGCEDRVPAGVRRSGATVTVLDPGRDVADLFPGAEAGSARFSHVRVFASTRGRGWPKPPDHTVIAAHEAVFLAAKSCRDLIAKGGSLGVHIDDDLRGGLPHPHTGLFTGIVKSLAWDLADARLAVVVADSGDAWELTNREVAGYTGNPSSVHHGGTRLTTKLLPAPTPVPALSSEPTLRPGAVVVATGGARGITAACVRRLAAEGPLKLWLIGSSQLDDVPEELLAAGDDELPAARAKFLRGRRASEPGVTVRELSKRFDRLVSAREAQLTLRDLRRSCGEDAVRYLSCDLTDGGAVRRMAEEIRATDAEIDLVIHGAGLHYGGDIAQLSVDGLRRLREVKLSGYHHLKEAFSNPAPKAWCNFGSVAGLVGLPGETDYAPGNDFLHAAAQYSALVQGQAEVSLVWPIWSGVGMGSSDLMQGNNERAGIMASLPPAEGVEHFVTEVRAKSGAHPLVAFLNPRELGSFTAQFPGLTAEREKLPRWVLGAPYRRAGGRACWMLDLASEAFSFLGDHLVKDKPTLQGTGSAAIAAEAGSYLVPGASVVALHDLNYTGFVALKPSVNGRRGSPYKVSAEVLEEREGSAKVLVRITSDVVGRRGELLRADRPHFDCVVEMGRIPVAPQAEPLVSGSSAEDPYYRGDSSVWLGGVFKASRDGVAGERGASAKWVLPPAVRDSDRQVQEYPVVPTVMLDALARTRALREDENGERRIIVPRRFERIEFFVNGGDGPVSRLKGDGITLNHLCHTNVDEAVDRNGRVILRISGVDAYTMSDVSE